jgi:hypothetical protein
MAIVNLPSARKAKTLAEVIDVVEKMRKELEFALSTLDTDNMNSSYVSVVESGANGNGSYRKFSDGTMECWRSWQGPANTLTWQTYPVSGSTYYYSAGSWIFPQPFIEGKEISVFASGDIPSPGPETHTAFAPAYYGCSVECGILDVDVRTHTSNVYRSWLARGYWK